MAIKRGISRTRKIENGIRNKGKYNPDLFNHLDSFTDVSKFDEIPKGKLTYYYESEQTLGFYEEGYASDVPAYQRKFVKKYILQTDLDKLLSDSSYKIFWDFIKHKLRFPSFRTYKEEEFHVFRHLIEMMDTNHLNRVLEECFSDELKFDDGFYDFHKSMRQVDFFDSTDEKIGGHLDMVFWNFIHISDAPQKIMKEFLQCKKEEKELIL